MRDIENKFMDRCIVLHDYYNNYPIVIRIDKIEAIHKEYNNDNDNDNDNECSVICLHCTTLNVSESIETILRILQRRG